MKIKIKNRDGIWWMRGSARGGREFRSRLNDYKSNVVVVLFSISSSSSSSSSLTSIITTTSSIRLNKIVAGLAAARWLMQPTRSRLAVTNYYAA